MHPKAKEYAKTFIENHLRFCATDCSDSMHEADDAEARFEAVTDDADIWEFIKEHLMVEYADAMIETLRDNGETLDSEDIFGVCDPKISVASVKAFLGPQRK